MSRCPPRRTAKVSSSSRNVFAALIFALAVSAVFFCSVANTKSFFERFHALRFWSDERILIFGPKEKVTANLVLNVGKPTAAFLTQIGEVVDVRFKNQGARGTVIAITGPYTGRNGETVGLTVQHGKIHASTTEKWDGYVVFDKSGQVSIFDLSDLGVAKSSNIETLPPQLLESSGFQTHLIVKDGRNEVQTNAPSIRARRRAIVTTQEANVGIVDSLDEEMTLFEWASLLVKSYSAVRAVNLDMGTYNICVVRSESVNTDCSHIGNDVRLSNAIVLSTPGDQR